MIKLPIQIDLTNKVAVVTGGTGLLGGQFAEALAACGARVAVLGRKLEDAEQRAAEIVQNGGIAIGVAADVVNRESLKEAHEVIRERLGPVDILINGAGGNHPHATTTKEYLYPEDVDKGLNDDAITFLNLNPQDVQFVFDLNFLGTLLPSQQFAADMINRPGATIINITSMSAFSPLTKIPAYSAAKASISNFTEWLAVHMSKVGIRVNAIAPGFFLSEQNKKLLQNEDGSYTERSQKILNKTPMDRFGEGNELIGTLLYLVSHEASGFVNGVVIPVDGAFNAYSGV